MSEMVERVMHVIQLESGGFIPDQDAERIARAAIAAMREPTEEMCRAAAKAGDDYVMGDSIMWNEIPVMWKAMLDEALTEKAATAA